MGTARAKTIRFTAATTFRQSPFGDCVTAHAYRFRHWRIAGFFHRRSTLASPPQSARRMCRGTGLDSVGVARGSRGQASEERGSVAITKTIDDLPLAPGLPLVGSAIYIDPRRAHRRVEKWTRELGSMFRMKFGKHLIVVVSDHVTVGELLRDRPEGFRGNSGIELLGAELGLKSGIFNAEGDDWRRQRRMVMSGFDPHHPSLLRRPGPCVESLGTQVGRHGTRWCNHRPSSGFDAIHGGCDLQSRLRRINCPLGRTEQI